MIKMEALRQTLTKLGLENVKSYINSGNLVFDMAKANDRKLALEIHDAVQDEFGFDVSVMVRPMAEIEAIVAKDPFAGQFESHKDVHVFFLDAELTEEQRDLLDAQACDTEIYDIDGRHVSVLLKKSILDSAVGKGFIDKKLKVAATARNWRTVQKIVEL